ncbi:MAG: magnesium transporter [Planctomycetota bacterium]
MLHELLAPDLRQTLDEGDDDALREFCEALHPADTAAVLYDLDAATIWRVLKTCRLETRVEIFESLELVTQFDLVHTLSREELSALVEAMSPDDRATLLNKLDDDTVEDLLPLVAQAERADIRRMLLYPEDSAGSIMTTDYASISDDLTAAQALDHLRKQAPDKETIYYVYIVDEQRRLDGVITLRDLILARPTRPVSELMTRDVVSVRVTEDQEDVAHEVGRYDFIAIPVVDEMHRLVGIITHDDIHDILREEADEDAQRIAAVEPLEDDYISAGVRELALKRGRWLTFLAVVAIATGILARAFEDGAERFAWAVFFLPLVLAAGGNAGSQSATLTIRSLSHQAKGRAFPGLKLLGREVFVGLLLGGALGLIGAGSASLFFGLGPIESAVVGVTVLAVVNFGTVIGLLLPIGFDRLGVDPALMSSPLITAIMDLMAVLLYYGVALWAIERLLPLA